MNYETVGTLIFGHNRLKFKIDACKASGARMDGAEWEALLAHVAAMDLAFDELQRQPARFDAHRVDALLSQHTRASEAFKALQC